MSASTTRPQSTDEDRVVTVDPAIRIGIMHLRPICHSCMSLVILTLWNLIGYSRF
jgi:hypothetical protein